MEPKLTCDPKSCWEIYDTKKHRKAMEDVCGRYRDFLSRCKTEREVVAWGQNILKAKGFSEDFSSDLVMRDHRGKTLFFARKGKRPLSDGIRLIGSHADSPRVDFKQHPLYEECEVGLAKTHYYGGIKKYQWFSRPLALHGVIAKTNGETVHISIGDDPADPVFVIADLLPHLSQKQNEQKVSEAFEAEKMNIYLGHAPAEEKKEADEKDDDSTDRIKRNILQLLNKKYGIVEEDLYSAEIQAVPAGPAREVGLDTSMIGSYGQDDRICVFTSMEAFLESPEPEYTQVVIFWDKEEIGSDGSTGAQSLFFEYCMEDLIDAWEPETKFRNVMNKTRALSSDVHSALDPDYQEVHEKLNASRLGYGPVFCKFTGHRGKYGANDAHAEYVAWLRRILNEAGVPWQMAELGRVDLGGGGTVAKYLAIYGMNIIDFGPGILSMHSPFEISSKMDVYATVLAYKVFLKN
ncbi:MAG: aminopeptidase [Desulfoplanes sp.]